jgi:hypothetical protein
MTTPSGFTDEEWDLVREGPALAGMIVITADKGGSLRETFALAKAYGDARRGHGESKLLDEIASAGPPRGRRYGSAEELRQEGLSTLRRAASLVERTRTSEEAQSYRAFVLDLAERVARAHREADEDVSPRERAAIEEVAASLGGATS